MSDEESDEGRPFTIKRMSRADIKAIVQAAQRAQKPVGEWLGEAARAHIERTKQEEE